jgi:hypothetical protein
VIPLRRRPPPDRGRRALWLLILPLLAAACGVPVGVTRVDTSTAQRLLTESAVTSSHASERSLTVLRRFGLEERFDTDPDGALAELHRGFVQRGGEDRLFALAELSFVHATRSGDRTHALAAAVYAYALLFPGAGPPEIDPADPRFRLAYDLYNFALATALGGPDIDDVDLRPGPRRLPYGWLDLQVDPSGFTWLGYRLERFVSASSLAVHGLRNRYHRSGIGAPLAAGLARGEAVASVPGAHRIGPRTRIPVTALLRLESVRQRIASGALRGRLELYAADRASTVEIDGRTQSLESDPSAALALWLGESSLWDFEVRGFLRPAAIEPTDPDAPDGVYLLEPFRPDRIPVVLVHGTVSSPGRWSELINELRGDPRIRARYQIWLFLYNTSHPITYSAGRLRRALENTLREVDPAGTAPDLRRMVVIGHSQGGILARLTVTDSGDRFWKNAHIDRPLEDLKLPDQAKDIIRQSLFYTREPFVERVVFVATPHRGSRLAVPWVARLTAWAVTVPFKLFSQTLDLLPPYSDEALVMREIAKHPTSISNMSPGHQFIRALDELPIAPGVAYNSIIAVEDDEPLEEASDGVVAYPSAHLEGAESELIVHSGHSVQGNPYAIEEIRRILLEHAGIRTPPRP